jgi:hypothetical protein
MAAAAMITAIFMRHLHLTNSDAISALRLAS